MIPADRPDLPPAALAKLFSAVKLTATTCLGFPPSGSWGPPGDVRLEVVLTVSAADGQRVDDLPAGVVQGASTAVVRDRTSDRTWIVGRDCDGGLMVLPYRVPVD